MYNDILSVIFLALIAIVISAMILNISPGNILSSVPIFALIATSLWIAYDYIVLSRTREKEACVKEEEPIKMDEDEQDQAVLRDVLSDIHADNKASEEEDIPIDGKPVNIDEKHKEGMKSLEEKLRDQADLNTYSGMDFLKKQWTNWGCDGDNQICNRMKYMSVQPQMSKNFRAAYDKYSAATYFQEELDEQENNKIWWECDQMDIHT